MAEPKDFSKGVVIPTFEDERETTQGFKMGIVRTRWNDKVVGALTNGCHQAMLDCGVKEENIHTFMVPGSFELPLAAKQALEYGKLDAVVCIGTLIKGETHHYEYI